MVHTTLPELTLYAKPRIVIVIRERASPNESKESQVSKFHSDYVYVSETLDSEVEALIAKWDVEVGVGGDEAEWTLAGDGETIVGALEGILGSE